MSLPALMSFANPPVSTDFSTTVPTGQAWKIHAGSCHIQASAVTGNRTPTLYFKLGNNYVYVASNGLDYEHGASQNICFYQQRAFQDGPPYDEVAGEVWNITNNPGGPVINPVGIRDIWLPEGTVIRFFIQAMQAGDQMSQVYLYVESQPMGVIDGLGAMKTIADPAAGQNWQMTVPNGKAWRPWGGSCHYLSSGAVLSRNPLITYENSNGVLWFGSQQHGNQANTSYDIAYHDGEVFLTDLYINQFIPVALKAMWLPAGTTINGRFDSIQGGDQVSNVGLLIEEVAA